MQELLANTLLTAIIEATTDGMLVVDNTGKIIMTNKRFAEMWGIPEDVLATHDDKAALAFVLKQLSDPDAFIKKVTELYTSDEVLFDVLEFADGRYFERSSRPLFLDKTRFARLWSFHDVTERRKNELLLTARAEDLERMNALMVGREVKMAEMKNELEALKAGRADKQ